MASFITVADIIASAVEIERRGHAFYTQAATTAPDMETQAFFTHMAQEELRHQAVFQAMLERTGGLQLPAGSSDADYLEYVAFLLDSHNMFLKDQQNEARSTPLRTALAFEKDTILFFSSMRRLVPDTEHAAIDACIAEEEKHIRLLAEHAKAQARAQGNA